MLLRTFVASNCQAVGIMSIPVCRTYMQKLRRMRCSMEGSRNVSLWKLRRAIRKRLILPFSFVARRWSAVAPLSERIRHAEDLP